MTVISASAGDALSQSAEDRYVFLGEGSTHLRGYRHELVNQVLTVASLVGGRLGPVIAPLT